MNAEAVFLQQQKKCWNEGRRKTEAKRNLKNLPLTLCRFTSFNLSSPVVHTLGF